MLVQPVMLPDARSLVGRFIVPENCGEIEFVPASTSAKYKCEFLGRFTSIDVIGVISKCEYARITSWKWLSSTVLLVDCASVTHANVNIHQTPSDPLAFTADTSAKKHAGQVKAISGFLRTKDANDPFTNAFCIHLVDGNVFVLRGSKLFLFRHLIEPNSFVEFSNFRKIKLKSFDNRIVWLSVDDSTITKYEPLSASSGSQIFQNSEGREMRGRVISLDPPVVWLSVSGRTGMRIVPLVMGRWGLCDKRRIGVGAVLTIRNFHIKDNVVGFCPSSTSLIIEDLSPLSTGVVSIHTFCANTNLTRCFSHVVDGGSECASRAVEKFSINSLCACDCFVTCDMIKDEFIKELTQLSQVKLEQSQQFNEEFDHADKMTKLKGAMSRAITEAEVCLSLVSLKDVLCLRAPPFFNTGVLEPLKIELKGSPTPEVSAQLSELPKPLYLSLFPPNRPLNAFCLVTAQGTGNEVISLLIPRDIPLKAGHPHLVNQMLIISTESGTALNGMIIMKDALIQSGEPTNPSPRVGNMSPSKLVLSRRKELFKRLFDEI